MAHILPDGWQQLAAEGAFQREIETLEVLSETLSDNYTVYHGVHWSRVEKGAAHFGEIDFIIVNPVGQILAIEQKSGLLQEGPEGLIKQYSQGEKRIPVQLARNRDALFARLKEISNGETVKVDALLYCPDYTIKAPAAAGIDPARIVDASKRTHLAQIIRQILPEETDKTTWADRVHGFMRSELTLMPDVNALVGESQVLFSRISGGLTHWARQIDCQPFRLRVIGTAGSGKTQLALNVLNDAVTAGRRALYVCYNRPLADHISLIAPAGVEVATYHQLADRLIRTTGRSPDFSQPGAFKTLEEFMARYDAPADKLFDELVIDEGQDFRPEWLTSLLRMVRMPGRVWWLEDPMQNLYGRSPVDLAGWVTLKADINYRSPRDILGYLNKILGSDQAVESGNPIVGSEIEILTYGSTAELMDRTKTAITRGLGAGFKKNMLAIVTYRGREHSHFTPLDRLGPNTLRSFSGQYDLLGNPVYNDGDIFIESVYRFKGQAAPCVIFTEIDFEELDDKALRKLFVGMTRATLKLILVISERAAQNLMKRL